MHSTREIIELEAADWFVRNRGGGRSLAEREQFAAWLRSSPLHVEEYLRTAVASRDLQAVARTVQTGIDEILASNTARGDGTVVPLVSAHRSRVTRQRVRWAWPKLAGLAAAAVLFAAIGTVWLERDGQRFDLPKTYSTAHGEQRSWLLPDGSSLSLDSDTAVTVSFNERERLIRVEKGQALFAVVHEPLRRFRVSAGDTGVIAVGTAFSVDRTMDTTRVTVVEGKVAVFTGDAPKASAQAVLPSEALALIAGEQVRIVDHGAPGKPSHVNLPRAVAWVQHQIAFDQQPLGDVAEQFNHYSGAPITIENDRIRGILISGVFDAYDTDSFLKFISRLDNVSVEKRPDRVIVSDVPK
jgi:transmembrane sensor